MSSMECVNNEMLTVFMKHCKNCSNGVLVLGRKIRSCSTHRFIEKEPVAVSFRPRISLKHL